jgi:hypothetical protein
MADKPMNIARAAFALLVLLTGVPSSTSAQAPSTKNGAAKAGTKVNTGPPCAPNMGYIAADTSSKLNEGFLLDLKRIGIETVIKYYDYTYPTLPDKPITKADLALIAKAGMSVAAVFQHNNDSIETFMRPGRGTKDAQRSLELAKELSQPPQSAIYFGVDGVDADFLDLLKATDKSSGAAERHEKQLQAFYEKYIRDYFTQARAVLVPAGYKIGVYGSGRVCRFLLDNGLATYCWLANARSWPEYSEMEKSKRWVLKQHIPTARSDCFGVEVDLNSGNGSTKDFGQWKPQ